MPPKKTSASASASWPPKKPSSPKNDWSKLQEDLAAAGEVNDSYAAMEAATKFYEERIAKEREEQAERVRKERAPVVDLTGDDDDE